MKKIELFIMVVVVFLAVAFLKPAACFSQEEEGLSVKSKAVVATGSSTAVQSQYDETTEKAIKDSQEALKYTSDNLRDPFTLNLPQAPAASAQPKALPQFKVDGFIWGSSIPQAIINGKVYGVGDTVESAKITKIDKTGVTILFNGSNYVIK